MENRIRLVGIFATALFAAGATGGCAGSDNVNLGTGGSSATGGQTGGGTGGTGTGGIGAGGSGTGGAKGGSGADGSECDPPCTAAELCCDEPLHGATDGPHTHWTCATPTSTMTCPNLP